jgi:putative transposase
MTVTLITDSNGVVAGAAAEGTRLTAAGVEAARVPLRELMDDRLLDALLERSRDEAGGLRLTGAGSMLGELVAAVLERALQGELTAHLGYGKHDLAEHGTGNSRNGVIAKTVQTGLGPVPVNVPRGARVSDCGRGRVGRHPHLPGFASTGSRRSWSSPIPPSRPS